MSYSIYSVYSHLRHQGHLRVSHNVIISSCVFWVFFKILLHQIQHCNCSVTFCNRARERERERETGMHSDLSSQCHVFTSLPSEAVIKQSRLMRPCKKCLPLRRTVDWGSYKCVHARQILNGCTIPAASAACI